MTEPLPPESLQAEAIDVGEEIERLLPVVTAVGQWGGLAVHLVGDILDVLLNLRGWNDDIRTQEGQRRWGRRAVTYLVFDPASGLSAPAKFCAYSPIHMAAAGGDEGAGVPTRMAITADAELNVGKHAMDGHRAQRHLSRALGLRPPSEAEMPFVTAAFGAWCQEKPNFWKKNQNKARPRVWRAVAAPVPRDLLPDPTGREWPPSQRAWRVLPTPCSTVEWRGRVGQRPACRRRSTLRLESST